MNSTPAEVTDMESVACCGATTNSTLSAQGCSDPGELIERRVAASLTMWKVKNLIFSLNILLVALWTGLQGVWTRRCYYQSESP